MPNLLLLLVEMLYIVFTMNEIHIRFLMTNLSIFMKYSLYSARYFRLFIVVEDQFPPFLDISTIYTSGTCFRTVGHNPFRNDGLKGAVHSYNKSFV